MQLLFLRHGPAESKNDWSGADEDRPLTVQGRMLVNELAHSLIRLNAVPDLVLASPYVRARETARIVGDCLGAPEKVVIDKRLGPGFGMKHLEKIVREHADAGVLMLVGHDPDLSDLVRTITGGRLSIRKGGLAQVEIPDAKVVKGRLVCLLVPTPPDDSSLADAEA
jgi:phosphohistidine phosphatase